MLVIAGAGSGKTRVITRRIANLIRVGNRPSSILGLTFTNKAAGEMRERVKELVGSDEVFLSTFHSMGARILRIEGSSIGIPSNYSIYDSGDQVSLVKKVLKELNIDSTHFRPRSVLESISKFKNNSISPDEAASSPNYYKRVVASVYARYVEEIRASQALDFDDLQLEMLRLLRECQDVLEKYQRRFKYVLIDEYQDTNMIQYELAKLLAGDNMNLCATGDPDQSIYTWRGADLRNILEFEKDYPGAKVIKLEQNYRSTGNILKAADSVILNNTQRKSRTLWTEAPDGDRITLHSALGESDEAEFVVKALTDQKMKNRLYSDAAIFYRTNALSRALERALTLSNIPYIIVGGLEFFERREIKDLMGYLKLIDNPKDSVAFYRIVNTPTRSIGQRTTDFVKKTARQNRCSPLEAARKICDESLLAARQVSALKKFLTLYETLSELPKQSVEGVLQRVLAETSFTRYLEMADSESAAERIDNVNEMIYAVAEYDKRNQTGDLHGFLEETALIRGIDSYEDDEDRVVLMTIHTAKGLEFPIVFLVGLEDGVLPHMLTLDDGLQIEEERRLFYVGITRAREKLYLTRSSSRVRQGSMTASLPSRFIKELSPELIEESNQYRMNCRASWEAGNESPSLSNVTASYDLDTTDSVLEYDQDVAPEFKPGELVIHPYFGRGKIQKVNGRGPSAMVMVKFQKIGEKRLVVKYAKLKKVL